MMMARSRDVSLAASESLAIDDVVAWGYQPDTAPDGAAARPLHT